MIKGTDFAVLIDLMFAALSRHLLVFYASLPIKK